MGGGGKVGEGEELADDKMPEQELNSPRDTGRTCVVAFAEALWSALPRCCLALTARAHRRGRRPCVRRFARNIPDSVRRYTQRYGGGAAAVVALNRVLIERHELPSPLRDSCTEDDGSDPLSRGEHGQRRPCPVTVRLDADDVRAWHIRHVLKLGDGDRLRAGIVDGALSDSTRVDLLPDGGIQLSLFHDAEAADDRRPDGSNQSAHAVASAVGGGAAAHAACPPRPAVNLLLALPRPGIMGRLWPTLAAMGVGTVVICNACRVERAYFNAKAMREGEVRAGLVEGLMQAGNDTRLPRVLVRKKLEAFLEDELDSVLDADALRVVAHPEQLSAAAAGAGETRGRDDSVAARRLSTLPLRPNQTITVAIGPEGGWLDRELAMLARCGFESVSLGQRILRTEVACTALLALAHERIAAAGQLSL